MVEWLTAGKFAAVLSEGLKSIVATGSKEIAGRATKKITDSYQLSTQGNPFGENGPISDALLPLALSGREAVALKAFLNSDLFLSILKSSVAVSITNQAEDRDRFSNLIFLYLSSVIPDRAPVVVENFCTQLSKAVVEASDRVWAEAGELGLVNPAEAVITSTQSLVSAEIANINAHLLNYADLSLDKLREYELFEKRYREAIGNLSSKLKPATLSDARETPIDSLYVASNLRALAPRSPQREGIDRATLLNASFRTVILGTPGGGKSTFAAKLCYDLNARYRERLYGGRALTPVSVVLKDYAKYRKANPCSIVDFVTMRCNADLQIHAPEGAFRYLFLTGRAMIIFDGLDELLETSDRIQIKQVVESFVGQYPVVPVLVTSREVGYEQAPLDREKFEAYRLEPFNDDQVEEYVSKWFGINRTPGKSRDVMASAFMRDSSAVQDLRQNPLMLSLLCSLYKQDGYLPSNRPAVYKRCADLLFETWDRGRDIVVNLPLDRKLRPAMAHLAHWIYSDSTLQGGVKESTLVAQTASYLLSWCTDLDEAHRTAEKFISFFRGRAWVFSDTGSSKHEPLYQFTHRTFLEFFTAEHLAKNYGSVRELTTYLLPRLLEREWDVVCQLVYQMSSEMGSASDDLVSFLIQDATQQDLIARLRLSSFLARSLDFIFPTRHMRINAVKFCVLELINSICNSSGVDLLSDVREGVDEEGRLGAEILEALMNCTAEMIELHSSECARGIIEFVHGTASPRDRAHVLACIDGFEGESDFDGERLGEQSAWPTTRKTILEATSTARAELNVTSPELAISSWWNDGLDVADLIGMHGVISVFAVQTHPLQGWMRVPIAEFAVSEDTVHSEIPPDRLAFKGYAVEQGKKLPSLILSYPYPWFVHLRTLDVPWNWAESASSWPVDLKLRELALLMLVSGTVRETPKSTEFGKEAGTVIRAHVDPNQRPKAHKILLALAVGAEVTEFMSKWIDGSI